MIIGNPSFSTAFGTSLTEPIGIDLGVATPAASSACIRSRHIGLLLLRHIAAHMPDRPIMVQLFATLGQITIHSLSSAATSSFYTMSLFPLSLTRVSLQTTS
jgi:hypothetical protein